mgnify:CR=1 FL=1
MTANRPESMSRPAPHRAFLLRALHCAIGFALSVIVLQQTGGAEEQPGGDNAGPLNPAAFVRPVPGALMPHLTARGVFEPLLETPVPTRIQKTISYIARDGEAFKKGDLILRLDDEADIRGRDDRLDIIQREVKRLEQTVQRFLQERVSLLNDQERRGWEAELARLERRQNDAPALETILNAEERRYSTLRQLEAQVQELRLLEETMSDGAYPLNAIEQKRSAIRTTELNLRSAEIALEQARAGATDIEKRSLDMALTNRRTELDASVERENEARIRHRQSVQNTRNSIAENIRRYDRENRNLLLMKLVSPKDGIVSVKTRWGNPWAVGQRTHNGSVPVSITDNAALKAVVFTPDPTGLKAGFPVIVNAPALGRRRIAGKILSVSDQGEDEFKPLASETRQIVMGDAERIVYRVEVELIETPRELVNGMNCEVHFLKIPSGPHQTRAMESPSDYLAGVLKTDRALPDALRDAAVALGAPQGLIIPASAARTADDGRARYVWVARGAGSAVERLAIEVAAETALETLVVGGLTGDERIYSGAMDSETDSQ